MNKTKRYTHKKTSSQCQLQLSTKASCLAKRIGTYLYGLLIILICWYVLHLSVKNSIVPSPYETFIKLGELLKENLLQHLLHSSYRILIALIISIIIGFPLGLLTGLSSTFDFILSPVAYILYPLPKVAFLPLFMLLFGLGDTAKIILLTSIIVFQIQLAIRDSVKQIPLDLYYSAKTLGLNQTQTILHCVIPAILPNLFSALRITIGICISALFLSENFATTYGIGYFIMNSWIMVDYPAMFAGIVTLGTFAALIFKGIDLLEKILCKWQYVDQKK
ncbi:MAG: ABC transporter permease [Turicibacter sp.]